MSGGMEAIKELVERALEKKRVLSQMKAELRAQVFLAIEEEETSSGFEGLAAKTRNPQRDSLLSSEEGTLLVALVREFLEWAGLEFTAKVFEPEMGPAAQYHGRMGLSKQLGMSGDVASQAPLLLKVLKQCLAGSAAGRPKAVHPNPPSPPPPPITNTHPPTVHLRPPAVQAGAQLSQGSANVSHELGGYAPPSSQQPQTKGHSNNAGRGSGHDDDGGGLSFSGELPPHPDEEHQGSSDLSHSGGPSPDAHHTGTQRPPNPQGKLNPLGPPPLAPLGSAKLGPLSGPAPTHAPKVLSPPSKQGDALKEELYRQGLLPVRTKSQPSVSQEEEDGEQASGQGSSHQSGGAVSGGGSSAAASSRRSSIEVEEEEEVVQKKQQQQEGQQQRHSEGEPPAPESPEPSSGHSSNHNPSSRHSSKRSTSGNRRQGYEESKAVSMDLRDTGLSASDQSGDLETGALPLMGLDMEETAEWGN
ncbi:hypothetical protein DUNSADRAFT_11507 [Dunaliella salina]|uniref:FGFR1 oncogene partner (FOP) N-terminal dimerisation domain-containing protein n=1 Tax=Dunaliella salina TaxID=3046 RepID=A0ABQ7H4E7_DUNSA|nr:hypothetical protein DUNSADRAFT_11507 [Dunaliella salina]|eukprot:KAF5841727.1 hypothetical protein DUNSADRAFT_11507 [Dunaliella salina]